MKLTSFTVPVLIVLLTALAVSGVGMLTVRVSAASTLASINLLQVQLRLARLQQQLLERNRESLEAQAQALRQTPPDGPAQPWAGDRQP